MKKISVIIPVYNSSQYLFDALNSVVQQEITDYEIIVVDDGSSKVEHENYIKIVNSFKNTIIFSKENGGAASARNYGARRASGEILAFLDSDDVWLAGKLVSQLKVLDDENADVVLGNILVADNLLNIKHRSSKKVPTDSKKCMEGFFYGRILMNTPTIIVKKSFFEQLGGFNEQLKYREDHYFLINCAAKGKIALDEQFHTIRRERENSLSMVSDIDTELGKHVDFWTLASDKYRFLNVRKARVTLLLRLFFYYLRMNRQADILGVLNYIKKDSRMLYVFLSPVRFLTGFAKLLFNLRGSLRRALK
ncbi:glycosyltransferase [Erwinia sp. MYb375]|uniref:glycosyltransferase family 2 protein n=1 Tax=unclassified Erwinia TaxID=2622719 RepID=UPI0030A318F5